MFKLYKGFSGCTHSSFFGESLINRWNRLSDSADFTSLLSFKRFLDTVDFSLLNYTITCLLCVLFCVHLYGQLLEPLAFLSYGTLSVCVSFVLLYLFLPARRYASAGYSDRNVSVRPSVTRRYCVKTKKASGMISSPSGSPKTLVFCRQISSPNSKGFPLNGGPKQRSVVKIQRFFSFKRLYLENGSRYGQSYY